MEPGALYGAIPVQDRGSPGEADQRLQGRVRFSEVRRAVAKKAGVLLAKSMVKTCGPFVFPDGKGKQSTILLELVDDESPGG